MDSKPAGAAPQVIKPRSGAWCVFGESGSRILNCELQGTVFIGFASYINSGIIRSYSEIGRYCSIGRDVSVGLGNHYLEGFSTSPFFESTIPTGSMKLASLSPKRRLIIGNDCWIGDGVKIVSGVRIGNGAVIAAGAVVTKDVEPYEVVGGIPAKHIRYRFDETTRRRMEESAWWERDPEELRHVVSSSVHETLAVLESTSDTMKRYPVHYERVVPQDSAVKNDEL